MLSDGWVHGQAGFTFLPYWGGEEDAQAPKGPKRAGWALKIKTCKFLSYPPAWATPAFLPPALGFHTFHDRLGKLQTICIFLCCLCEVLCVMFPVLCKLSPLHAHDALKGLGPNPVVSSQPWNGCFSNNCPPILTTITPSTPTPASDCDIPAQPPITPDSATHTSCAPCGFPSNTTFPTAQPPFPPKFARRCPHPAPSLR